MIIIDRINEAKVGWYRFPTIDFKFQNRGRATAFLWQFAIEVIHTEIDPTPELVFRSYVKSGTLLVDVTNNGWGDANNCHVQLDEPILNRLFSGSARQYRGTLQSGIEQNIFQFSTVTADARQFQIIKGQFKDLPYRERQKRGLILDPANINWQCNNSQHKGEAQVLLEYPIVLTEFGFEKLFEPPAPPPYPSDTTYGAIIDPSVGPYEKKYPISRKIAPGDVERFHIMVGSSMSCHLQVRFKFFIDQTTVIESEIFNISIWNPRNRYAQSAYEHSYTDDKNKLRKDFLYDRDQTQPDSSIFPLTSEKSRRIFRHR